MTNHHYLRFSAFITAVIIFILAGCLVFENRYSSMAPGVWRAVLDLENLPDGVEEIADIVEVEGIEIEEVTEGELPFLFDVIYKNETEFYIEIINGEERIRLDDITIGRDRSTGKDTILIHFPVYQSYIKAIFEERIMEGEWVVMSKENYRIPIVAKQGKNHRFTTLRKPPAMDISGTWEATFEIETDHPYKAIGEFQQEGNHLSGTFMTESGDYRFLEGTVQADKFYLSCFDGAHSFLFEGKITEDETLLGSFRNGKHYKTLWQAQRLKNSSIRDPFTITKLEEGFDRLSFELASSDGNIISVDNAEYEDKALIVQILGSWCPNCKDATEFLVNYVNESHNADLAIIGLTFERYKNEEKALKTISTYKEKLKIPYEVVYAGLPSDENTKNILPEINHISSYPTLIFLNKNHQVQKIYTGFYGPATSKYDSFKQEFDKIISQLLAEN